MGKQTKQVMDRCGCVGTVSVCDERRRRNCRDVNPNDFYGYAVKRI